jgi:hypothetical protein
LFKPQLDAKQPERLPAPADFSLYRDLSHYLPQVWEGFQPRVKTALRNSETHQAKRRREWISSFRELERPITSL